MASIFTVTPTGGATGDLLAELANATLTVERDTQEAMALTDTTHYPIGIRYGWRLEGESFVAYGVTATKTLPQIAFIDTAISNTPVAVVIEFKPPTTAGVVANFEKYNGNGLCTVDTVNISDGPITHRWTIVGQAGLTSNPSASES